VLEINLPQTLVKFAESGGDKRLHVEANQLTKGRLLESCLDMLYISSEGKLWNGGSISMRLEQEQIFRDGSIVTFIPVPLNHELQNDERIGVFTLTKSVSNPMSIISSVGVKCRLTDVGHADLEGRVQNSIFAGIHDEDSIFEAIATLSINVLRGKIV
jgi:hypothetical protein